MFCPKSLKRRSSSKERARRRLQRGRIPADLQGHSDAQVNKMHETKEQNDVPFDYLSLLLFHFPFQRSQQHESQRPILRYKKSNLGDSIGQPRTKKFVSPKCYCGSNGIIFQSCTKLNPDRFFLGCPYFNIRISQPHCKYFYWLDMLVEEKTEEGGTCKNNIFMVRRLRELEQRVLDLNMELNHKIQNDVRGIQDNKYLRIAIIGLISILLVLALRGMV
ncbi:hypothetical protein PIB30_035985 [Stylosanthes scabra]|uniref:Zinc finger GRF-type domain-containing protein n=1 Tax=Stylosanthes scabra TaxID=79078 RepID=A0ABU6TD06_9FABA|nr:hypothetical protein [Stylosanthes scabra]